MSTYLTKAGLEAYEVLDCYKEGLITKDEAREALGFKTATTTVTVKVVADTSDLDKAIERVAKQVRARW